MAETSEETRADIKTRWKKGQSGNPKGRLAGSGNTVTWLARMLLERPVQSSESGERVTRLAEYMSDIVRRADAGDLKCRLYLIKAVERGDRRKEMAQRNAKKAKSEELRKFEEEMAEEISMPMPPLSPEVEEEQEVKSVRPTASASAKASADKPHGPAQPGHSPAVSAEASSDRPHGPATPPHGRVASAATLRRDPHTGRLLTPEGRELSREEEDRLLYPDWPHISPHLKKTPSAGDQAGDSAGAKSPAPEGQAIDSAKEFEHEKNSQENPVPATDLETLH